MALSKIKISRFVYVQEILKEVASDNDLNEEISDCVFLKSIGFKYTFALFKRNIRTVRDLVFSNVEDIVDAINGSKVTVTRMTNGLRRLYFSYGDITANHRRNTTCIPATPLTKTFAVLGKMTKEQLTVSIDLDDVNHSRLYKVFKKSNIVTFQDLKDAGIVKINNLRGLGRKTFHELFNIVEGYYEHETQITNSIIDQFRNHLAEANKEVKDTFEIRPLEERLYGYISEFVDSLKLGRSCEIFKLRNSLERMTFESIGEKYGLTKERIRQIIYTMNNKVAYNFVNRKNADTYIPINSFYREFLSIDKNEVMYPLFVLVNKKDAISNIIYRHFKAIGLSVNQIKIINSTPKRPKRIHKERKTKVIPSSYVVKSILNAVEISNGSWTINKLADLLCGNFDIIFDKNFSYGKKFYGLCKKYARGYIIDSIFYLLNEELLEYIDGAYKLCLTEDGKMVLEHL